MAFLNSVSYPHAANTSACISDYSLTEKRRGWAERGKAARSGGREPCALPSGGARPAHPSLAMGEWPSSLPPLQVPVRLSAFSRAVSHPDLFTDLAHLYEDLVVWGEFLLFM